MMAAVSVYQRRRNHHHDRLFHEGVSVSSIIVTAGLLILFFLSVLSFLTPLPDHHSSFLNPLRRASNSQIRSNRLPLTPILFLNSIGLKKNLVSAPSFVIPTGGGESPDDLWRSKASNMYIGCSHSTRKFPSAAPAAAFPNTYLMIATSGGLNQQRTGITDAVVAACILNATLVIPKLDQKSFWKDASNFSEIFDVSWFISSLSKDVKIVKQLPKKIGKVFNMRVPRKCTPKCYKKRVLPALMKKHVVQLTKFDYRLANKLETGLQKLRCRVNYHALKFTDVILEMGNKLIKRMKEKSNHFIALHLRFEPDMLAFSGCDYGGGEKERNELGTLRKRWKTLHSKNPEKERKHGKCPLSPEEVGLMLRALGFGSEVHIYVASGEVYGGEETLAPLKALFPHFHSKETLATKEELSSFSMFSSRMAAIDFMVCDGSNVFVTNNNGNMARILAGRRRYYGHKRTIRPNAKKLYSTFLNRTSMTWEAFATMIRKNQKGFMGEPNEVKLGRGEFHENPSACICESSINVMRMLLPRQPLDPIPVTTNTKSFSKEITDEVEPLEWSDINDDGKTTGFGYDLFTRQEEPELEDTLSD